MNVLTFRAAGAAWGVSVDDVQEIVNDAALTPLPLLPKSVAGVVDVRGLALPAIDFAAAWGGPDALPRPAHGPTFILVQADGRTFALSVDGVEGVLDDASVESASDERPWILGCVQGVRVIDPGSLVDSLGEAKA